MATKVIVRYKPPNPLIGRRELSPKDFESIGIFTQRKMLVFDKDQNYWLAADTADISDEAVQWFEESPEFTVERQEVPDEEDVEQARLDDAYEASLAPAPPQPVVEGESKSETSTTSADSTTTQSTRT